MLEQHNRSNALSSIYNQLAACSINDVLLHKRTYNQFAIYCKSHGEEYMSNLKYTNYYQNGLSRSDLVKFCLVNKW